MEGLKESGYWIYATDSTATAVCFATDLTGRVALVLDQRKGYPASSARKMRCRSFNTDGREVWLAKRFTDSYSIGRGASPALSHGLLNHAVTEALP